MNLYILRHAISVERGTKGYPDDSQRPLTNEGAKKMERIAGGMRSLKLEFDLILSSPHLRARQTAEIVATEFGIETKLKFSENLTSAATEALVAELNKTHRASKNILLVGHEPYLRGLISTLLTGHPNVSLVLKKGGLCRLTIETLRHGPCAQLDWLLTPRQIRSLR